MTNKINGIDVSECSYYNKDNEPYCCEVWGNECEAQNCYFKQLKRLQEENEEQKEQIKQLEDFVKSDGEICHINHEYTYKLQKVLQEVKSIAKGVRGYLEVPAPRDVRFEMDRILDLITEAELPDQKEDEEK